MKHTILVLGLCVALIGCGQAHRDLTPMVMRLDEASNSHDVEGVLKLLADDAVVKDPLGKTHSGKDAIRSWMLSIIPGFRVDSWGIRQSGDTITWTSRVWSSTFQPTGVNPIVTSTIAVVSGDKISFFNPALTPETQGKLRFAQFYVDVVQKGNVDAIDNYIADNMNEHQQLPPGMPAGKDGVKAYFRMITEAFPDMKVTPIMFLADGDRIVAYARWEGTNTGKFMGKPPTNRKVSFESIDIVRMENEKAVEHWGLGDDATMMRQLAGK